MKHQTILQKRPHKVNTVLLDTVQSQEEHSPWCDGVKRQSATHEIMSAILSDAVSCGLADSQCNMM